MSRVNGVYVIDPKKTPLELADDWAFWTIFVWQKKLRQDFHIPGGELQASFKREIIGTPQGGLIKINLLFKMSGRFLDMGVGKGTKIADVRENKTSRYLQGRMLGNRRRAKKWYGKTLFAETGKLKEILAQQYLYMAGFQIRENLDDHSKI